MRKKWISVLCILGTIGLMGCQSFTDKKEAGQAEKELFAMDTYMTLKAYGDNAEEAVSKGEKEIQKLDELLSTGKADSEISKLNESGTGILSQDTDQLIKKSLELYKDTGGIFDISIYPVAEAWGFGKKEYRVPSQEELDRLLPLVDAGKLSYSEEKRELTFGQEGMKIDLGGIAKGYTSSKIMEIYRKEGLTGGMVNLGGNVQTMGKKPDGEPWKIAIQSPEKDGHYLGVLLIQEKAVITSGGYERYFEENGIRYHHILDPSTGKPADSGLASVTIISDDGTQADGLSTSLFIMGKEKAEAYWREHRDEFDVILLTDDGKLYISEGIEKQFSSDREFSILKR